LIHLFYWVYLSLLVNIWVVSSLSLLHISLKIFKCKLCVDIFLLVLHLYLTIELLNHTVCGFRAWSVFLKFSRWFLGAHGSVGNYWTQGWVYVLHDRCGNIGWTGCYISQVVCNCRIPVSPLVASLATRVSSMSWYGRKLLFEVRRCFKAELITQ
jgi:hypothetical protein